MRRLVLLSLLLVGCQRTEMIIGIATDIRAPDLLDSVQLNVTRVRDGFPEQQLPPWTISGLKNVPFNLPGSYGVYSPDGSEPKLEIELLGLKNDQTVVRRNAIVSLVHGKTLFLRLGLTAGCRNRTDCAPTESCVEGACKPKELDPSVLPDFKDDLVGTLTCASGAAYINTEDGSPMPMSADANRCSTGCNEGTCLVPPRSTGSCSTAGNWAFNITCDNCDSGLNGGTVGFDDSGAPTATQNTQGCTGDLDRSSCADKIHCPLNHNGFSGQFDGDLTFSGDTAAGTFRGTIGSTTGNCSFTCQVKATRTNGPVGGPDGGGGVGPTGTCGEAGTYSFTPACSTCAGDTPPYQGPSTLTMGTNDMPASLPPNCSVQFFMGLECRLTVMCNENGNLHTVLFDFASAMFSDDANVGACHSHCSSVLLKQ